MTPRLLKVTTAADVTIMDNSSEKIRNKSLERIAEIFDVDADSLNDDLDLTVTFEPNAVKFWKRNQFDMVLDDIRDAAGKNSIELLNNGEFEVKTVGDYIRFMMICYEENPKLVQLVLGDV